jgi:hypothetical protein
MDRLIKISRNFFFDKIRPAVRLSLNMRKALVRILGEWKLSLAGHTKVSFEESI